MTGPAEWEFSGTLRSRRPAPGRATRRKCGLMAIEIVTFGCRLNTYESEVMRREAEAAGLGALEDGAVIFNTCAVTAEAVRQARQSIRKARRENPERAHHRHRLRRADRPAELRRHGRGRPRARQRGEAEGAQLSRAAGFRRQRSSRRRASTTSCRVRETAGAHGRRDRGPRARLRAGAERLRPSLHLLHHPLRPRQFALGADGRGGRAGEAARRQRLSPRSC